MLAAVEAHNEAYNAAPARSCGSFHVEAAARSAPALPFAFHDLIHRSSIGDQIEDAISSDMSDASMNHLTYLFSASALVSE
jgi:hypothetical protein